mgnify:FL=1
MSGINYATFIKHAEKVTKTASEGRPILKSVYHSEEGYAAVTDGHRLYIADGIYEGTEKAENPKTGELVVGNYPQVSKIVPYDDVAKRTVRITDMSEIEFVDKAVKILHQCATSSPNLNNKFVSKAKAHVRIYSEGDSIYFATSEESAIEARVLLGMSDGNSPDEINTYVNAEYISQAIAMFKDANIRDITMRFYGNLAPFTIKGGNLTVVVSPIKRGY